MNNPGELSSSIKLSNNFAITEKYNAWGKSMTDQLKIHFEKAASNPDTKVSNSLRYKIPTQHLSYIKPDHVFIRLLFTLELDLISVQAEV